MAWNGSVHPDKWVHANDGSGTGIWFQEDSAWPDVVVSVADVIQEAIIEGAEHWGVAFPMCPVHPTHPMDTGVVAGVASWVCPRGEGTPIQIGALHPTNPVGSGSGIPMPVRWAYTQCWTRGPDDSIDDPVLSCLVTGLNRHRSRPRSRGCACPNRDCDEANPCPTMLRSFYEVTISIQASSPRQPRNTRPSTAFSASRCSSRWELQLGGDRSRASRPSQVACHLHRWRPPQRWP